MFSGLYNTLITIAVVAAIAFVIYGMVRYENARPYLTGLIVLAFVVTGALSAFTAWDYYNTASKTVGELEEHDLYEDFNFYEYDLENFALHKDESTGELYFTTTYATSIEFNGTENKYTLLINDKPCEETMSNYGKLYGTTTIYFEDVDGSEKAAIDLTTNFTFYSSSIVLRIGTSATQENAGMLEEHFKIQGFNLRIIEEVNASYPVLSGEAA